MSHEWQNMIILNLLVFTMHCVTISNVIFQFLWHSTSCVGNDRVDIFYRVANPSIWTYYLPDPSTNRVSFLCMYKLVMAFVPGLLRADISIGSRQPRIDNRLQCTVS